MVLKTDTEQSNLLPLYFKSTLVPLELDKRPFLPTGLGVHRAKRCIHLEPVPRFALPSGTPSRPSVYWISLPQSPKPASRAFLASSWQFLLRIDREASVHTLRPKGCLEGSCV